MKRKDGFKGERSLVMPQAVIRLLENDPLVSGLFITDIGYYPHALFHFRQREDPINEHVFIYCVDGEGTYTVDGYTFHVKRDQYFILPAGLPHVYAANHNYPWTIYWIHFRGHFAKYYLPETLAPINVQPNMVSRINDRINLFEEVYKTLNTSYALDNIRYAMSTFQYFMATLRYIQVYRNPSGNNHYKDLIDLAIHYCEENIDKRLTAHDISSFVGLSTSRLSAVFKEKTGYSPMNYFNILKIKRACTLLETTNLKMNQICAMIGIDDQYYFSRLFSKIMGISPTVYRRKQGSAHR